MTLPPGSGASSAPRTSSGPVRPPGLPVFPGPAAGAAAVPPAAAVAAEVAAVEAAAGVAGGVNDKTWGGDSLSPRVNLLNQVETSAKIM